jgi:pimeloyl-ACP methyl ester carboxylesterase
MTPPHYLLAHGWGLDARSMQPLAQAIGLLQPHARVHVLDLGFFGAPQTLDSLRLSANDFVVVIGHSYGYGHLLQQSRAGQLPFPVQAWVSVCGFTQSRFLGADGATVGVSKRDVLGLQQGLKVQPQATLQSFHARCGIDGFDVVPPLAQANVPLLAQHLLNVRDLQLLDPLQPLLSLHGLHDLVVPTALTQHCFAAAGQSDFFDADHSLPMSQALACAQRIVQWLSRLD